MRDMRINEPDDPGGAPNFQRDLGHGAAEVLRAKGLEVPDDTTIVDALIMYVNSRFREIPARPREALWSPELRTRPLARPILDGVRRIEAASEKGEQLRPYQSTLLANPLYADALYNEWRIQHFHLDLPDGRPARPGFVRRTRDLLFGIVTENQLLLIDVRDHKSFADKELLEIVHRNWREVLAPWRLDDWSVDPEDVNEDHAATRRSRFTVLTSLSDGTVYAPLGGGVMFDKHGTASIVKGEVNRLRQRAYDLQQGCVRNEGQFLALAAAQGKPVDRARFELRVVEEDGTLHLVPCEMNVGTKIAFTAQQPGDQT
jgi:hypothetical protein